MDIVQLLFKRDDDDGPPPACAVDNDFNGHTNLRILSVFMVLISSAIGVYFPLLASRYSFINLPSWVFFIAKFFGSGVIVATAFIHLLEPASDSLGNPCLGGTFANYPWAFGICLMALFALFLIEIVSHHYVGKTMGGGHNHSHNMPTTFGQTHMHGVEDDMVDEDGSSSTHSHSHVAMDDKYGDVVKNNNYNYDDGSDDIESQKRPAFNVAQQKVRNDSNENDSLVDHVHNTTVDPLEHMPGHNHFSHDEVHQDITQIGSKANDQQKEQYLNQLTSLFILEFGILFHSVFVGLSLSVSGDEFKTLFVVIVFHQMFEGMGLGARITECYWPHSKRWLPYLLGFGYTITTPIAIAIGIGVRHSFVPGSRRSLIVNGVFDAISAGILVYAGLVELMAHEFLFTNQFKGEHGLRNMLAAYFVMALGAGLMALLGRWA